MHYTLTEIAAVCGGVFSGCDREVDTVTTDSRSMECAFGSSPLFVAMKGVNHDSHDYLPEMYARGVRAFLVERDTAAGDRRFEGCGFVRVENALAALQTLAADWRSRFRGTVIGVAGSNGKTVIKEWIARQAPAGARLFRSPKSYNSQLGVALSLLMMRGDESAAIIEAGISQPGEMARLERMIRPDAVLFTSLGDAHQENFASMEAKCAEKLLLAGHAAEILYHSDYALPAAMIRSRYADRRLTDAASCPVGEGVADPVLRRNAQLVAACCARLGYPMPDPAAPPAVAMRLEVKEGINDSILIDDTYNLDLNSLALALDALQSIAAGRRRTLILSDIPQSGLPDEELYARVAELTARAGVDRLVGVGERIRRQAERFDCDKEFYGSTEELMRRIGRDDVAGRVVLLKGSRESRFERLSHQLARRSHTTVLEVDLDAMIRNLNWFRSKLAFGTKLVAMVKAGSYGAGDFEVAQMLQHQGVDYLAVAFADEGVVLRERGISMPIVVLNADADSFEQMIAYRLEPEIYSLHSLDAFVEALRRRDEYGYPVHLKLDTGMHRLGFMEEEVEGAIAALGAGECRRRVRVASVFSHLNCSDTPLEDDYTRAQIARYDRMSRRIVEALGYPVIRHTAQSAGMERFPEAQFDMCRLGLGLYGFGYRHNGALRPVSRLTSRIVQIKRLAAGETVGYGRAGVLTRPSVTATVPIGYADGLDRHLGCGAWSMRVNGRPAPIVGRICMDSCMIDITDAGEVKEGDEVTVFSAEPGNTAEDMAAVLGTIPYEIMTSVAGRVKRIYLKE